MVTHVAAHETDGSDQELVETKAVLEEAQLLGFIIYGWAEKYL